jgi:hypothetical protein|tara:strand:- start:77 stop:436 length:360 start_codon:yes stop_codon:yes gene_type:complete
MKNLLKITFALFLFLLCTDCSNSEETNQKDISKLTDEEVFALKTFEIYEELSTKDIPIEDIKYRVFKDSNGFLTAKFELTGQTKKSCKWVLLLKYNLVMVMKEQLVIRSGRVVKQYIIA